MARALLRKIRAAGGVMPPAARFCLAAGVLGFLLLWQVSEPPLLFGDFYQAYFDAAWRVWEGGAVPTWPSDLSCVEGFVNIPIVAWLFVPLLPFGHPGAGWVFLILSLATAAGSVWLLVRGARPTASVAALLIMLLLVNGPLINALREGNLTSIVLALLALTLVLWRQGHEIGTGLVLGLATALKPPLLLLGLYFVARRRWRVVAATGAVLGGTAALSLAVFGIAINIGWYANCVEPFVGNVLPAFNVQSIDGFLARLMLGAPHLTDWSTHELTPIHRLLRLPILGLLYAAVAWPIARRLLRERGTPAASAARSDDLLDFSMLLVLAVVTSPISWTHYYSFLLLPLALTVTGMIELPRGRLSNWLIIGGYALSALPVIFPSEVNPPPVSEFSARTIVSAWLAGGLLMLSGLARAAWIREAIIGIRQQVPAAMDGRAPVPLLPLLGVLLVSGIGVSVTVWQLAPVAFRETTLDHTLAVLGGRMANDSWGPMWGALSYFEREYFDPRFTRPIYSEVFFNRHIKFQYPPTSLFAMAWMRDLHDAVGDWPTIRAVVSLEFLAATALAVAVLAHLRLRISLPSGRALHPALTGALALLATLTFYPLVKALSLGQIQTWINALLALALMGWVMGHRAAAGMLVGLVCLLKPQYALVLGWAALRREWRFLAAGALVVAAALALSLHVFGLANHLDYLRVLSFLSERGEGFYPNQTVNGVLNRIMSLAEPAAFDNLVWSYGRFPPANSLVHAGTVLTSAVILLAALLRRRLPADTDGSLDLARIVLSCTLASPIAWEHHYGVLLPILVLTLAASAGDMARLRWLAVSFVLAGNLLILANATAATPVNFVQSYLLAAALIVLAILHLAPARAVLASAARNVVREREAVSHA